MSRNALSLLFCVLLIFAVGVLMVFNTTSAEVLNRSLEKSTHEAFFRQLLYAFLGLIIAGITYLFGYRTLLKYSHYLYALSIFFLLLVFVPGIGHQINGAYRWIKILGVSFQPSEFVKLVLPLFFISKITEKSKPLSLKQFYKLTALSAIPIGLIFLEPDNGTVALLLVMMCVLCFLTRIKAYYWAAPLVCVTLLGSYAALQMPHVTDRIRIYLHPELDLRGKGHQPYQAKIASGSGRLFGRGLGESLQKLDYLPEARSDYIAAIYAEECGFVGISALIILYMALSFFGFSIALKTEDKAGYCLVGVFTFLIAFQAFLNLGVVSGLLPSKGINLPFFSTGGSSLIVNFLIISMILNIAADTKQRVMVEN